MARPRSKDKRDAILAAAARVVAADGLGAPTAAIAKAAGLSNGALFTYFPTKAELLNALYLALKREMGAAALAGTPTGSDARDQLRHVWTQWVRWATASPEKRRALAHLTVSDAITPASHRAASETLAGVAEVMERSRRGGPLRELPMAFVAALMNALAEATIDGIARDPAHADHYAEAAFEALWRVVA